MQSAAFCAEHQTVRVSQTCQGPGCAHTSCSGALHSHGQTSGKRAGFQKALPWKTSQKFQNLLQEQRLLWAARLRTLSRGSTLLKVLLSRVSQPQSLPKMCFCTPPLIQWWDIPGLTLSSPDHCGFLWWCGLLVQPWLLSPFPCQWGHSFCSCSSMTRCTQRILIRLGFSGDTGREHIPVHEIQKCLGRRTVTKALSRAPREQLFSKMRRKEQNWIWTTQQLSQHLNFSTNNFSYIFCGEWQQL